MFQIGNSLRTAREQQQLELAAVERETRIRTKYLQALEEERFDVLPGTAYVKGFLRTYADFLGLDGPRFVDEFNERFAPTELPEAPPPVRIRGPRRWLDARLVAIPLFVGIGLLGAPRRAQPAARARDHDDPDACAGAADGPDRVLRTARRVLALRPARLGDRNDVV